MIYPFNINMKLYTISEIVRNGQALKTTDGKFYSKSDGGGYSYWYTSEHEGFYSNRGVDYFFVSPSISLEDALNQLNKTITAVNTPLQIDVSPEVENPKDKLTHATIRREVVEKYKPIQLKFSQVEKAYNEQWAIASKESDERFKEVTEKLKNLGLYDVHIKLMKNEKLTKREQEKMAEYNKIGEEYNALPKIKFPASILNYTLEVLSTIDIHYKDVTIAEAKTVYDEIKVEYPLWLKNMLEGQRLLNTPDITHFKTRQQYMDAIYLFYGGKDCVTDVAYFNETDVFNACVEEAYKDGLYKKAVEEGRLTQVEVVELLKKEGFLETIL